MPLKATYEERIEDAINIAKTSKDSPGVTMARIMKALGADFGDGGHLDAIWAEYYASGLRAEIETLVDALSEYETKF